MSAGDVTMNVISLVHSDAHAATSGYSKCTDLNEEMSKMLIDYSSKNKEHFWACHCCSKAMQNIKKSLID